MSVNSFIKQPEFWLNKKYEHNSDVIAVKSLLNNIPKINRLIELNAGSGLITPLYYFRANKIGISDPSSHLLKIAKNKFTTQKIKYIHANLKNMLKKIRGKSVDVLIAVRAIYKAKDYDLVFKLATKILKTNGYLILEFSNSKNLVSSLLFLISSYTPLKIIPSDYKNDKNDINIHPKIILRKLESNGFEVIKMLTVSNLKNSFIKRTIPLETLLFIEQYAQKLPTYVHFGSSVYILARKRTT